MDYSLAQKNGFVEAFIDFMTARIPGWSSLRAESRAFEVKIIRARAVALIKGCVIHWQRSLSKIKKLISPEHLHRFESLIQVLRAEHSTIDDFNQAATNLRAEFPEIRAWLQWWLQMGNSELIFPAVMKMSKGMREKLPNTTNGGESSHWLLYRACGQKHDLWDGIRRAYMFQRELEALYMAVIGMSLFFLHKFHKF